MSVDNKELLKEITMLKEKADNCCRNQEYQESISLYSQAIRKCLHSDTELPIMKRLYESRHAAYEQSGIFGAINAECFISPKEQKQTNKKMSKTSQGRKTKVTKDNVDLLNNSMDKLAIRKSRDKKVEKTTIQDKLSTSESIVSDITYRKVFLPSSHNIKCYFQSFLFDPIHKEVPKTINPKVYIRAKIAFDEEKYDDIVPACSEEIKLPNSQSKYKGEALLLRASFYILSGNYMEAKNDLWEMIEKGNFNCSDMVLANALIKRALFHIHFKNDGLALEDFTASEMILPNNPDLYTERGEHYMKNSKIPLSLKNFEKAIQIAPNHSKAYAHKCFAEFTLAKLVNDQERKKIVLNELRNGIIKFPNSFICYKLLGLVLCDEQQFEEAYSLFNTTLKVFPKAAEIYVHLGLLIIDWKNDINAGIDSIKKAIKIDRKCTIAFEKLATIEFRHKSYNSAVELLDMAIASATIPQDICNLNELRNNVRAEMNKRN